MNAFYEQLNALLQSHTPFVSVTLIDAIGSIPQEAGAKMLVTAEGLHNGTVGGGKVEKRAIEEALAMLQDSSRKTQLFEWNLNRDIGMTCGGSVKFYFEVFNQNTWTIAIFGAGHVAQALIEILAKLDCRIICIDPRHEWLDQLPNSSSITQILSADMPGEVKNLPDDAFVALMTMGHTTDKPILLEILKTRQFPYLGVIGSAAKAVKLKKDIDEAGLPEACKNAFYCPIGLKLGNNHPQEIAISVAAQLLQERDRILATPLKASRQAAPV